DTIEKHRPRIDLLHCFSFPIPKFTGKVILTVHDFRHKENDLKKLFNPITNTIRCNFMYRGLRRTDYIIAVSNFTMNRLIHYYPFCKSKVSRVYHGFSSRVSYNSSTPRPHPKPYILTVGHIIFHKNHRNLILAFNKLLEQPDFEHDLVIVGRNYSSQRFFDSLKALCKKPERVIFTGAVSDSQLIEYYKHATLFVFPSLYEGFGIPLLEVSFHRVPFVVSDIEVFKELLAFPEAQFDPHDPDDIAAVIHKHLANPCLRQETLDWAAMRFSSFSWTNTARETLQLYGELAESQRNVDPLVVRDFGLEWLHFDQSKLSPMDQGEIFSEYFANFPMQNLQNKAIGFDLGCGSGRWAAMVAPRVAELLCIDPSSNAINIARKNLTTFKNCKFHQAGVDNIPLPDNSADFGYSLGVLHHIPDTAGGIKSCVRKLKSGAPFLLYLYYAFDNRPIWFRFLWKISNCGRILLSRTPYRVKSFCCDLIATFIYWPLARTSWILEKIGLDIESFPLSYYRNRSFYVMRTDALDRFGTKLEKRFTKQQIQNMMEEAGLQDIRFNEGPPYWVAVGTKK
ncbi:MAG: glycosyltransferase, partial [Proteobacteria bacterium]|nr:glycosyltransferase [Pseudomonadota bacterium]MCG2759315.1 glycosyltransferase [Desulfobacteraceae bacterium]